MRLDIVMPAHNEEDRIDRTLRAYRAACPEDGVRFIVALDSCSTARADRTSTGREGRRRRAAQAAGDDRATADLLGRAADLDAMHPTYYGSAWVALRRAMLEDGSLGRCSSGQAVGRAAQLEVLGALPARRAARARAGSRARPPCRAARPARGGSAWRDEPAGLAVDRAGRRGRSAGRRAGSAARSSPSGAWPSACRSRAGARSRTAPRCAPRSQSRLSNGDSSAVRPRHESSSAPRASRRPRRAPTTRRLQALDLDGLDHALARAAPASASGRLG